MINSKKKGPTLDKFYMYVNKQTSRIMNVTGMSSRLSFLNFLKNL